MTKPITRPAISLLRPDSTETLSLAKSIGKTIQNHVNAGVKIDELQVECSPQALRVLVVYLVQYPEWGEPAIDAEKILSGEQSLKYRGATVVLANDLTGRNWGVTNLAIRNQRKLIQRNHAELTKKHSGAAATPEDLVNTANVCREAARALENLAKELEGTIHRRRGLAETRKDAIAADVANAENIMKADAVVTRWTEATGLLLTIARKAREASTVESMRTPAGASVSPAQSARAEKVGADGKVNSVGPRSMRADRLPQPRQAESRDQSERGAQHQEIAHR